jgi:hypothetical protein
LDVIVNPKFAIEKRDIDDFLAEFGPFNGRYVPGYPKNWLEALKDQIDEMSDKELPPVKRIALGRRIATEIPLCIARVDWPWQQEKSWEWNLRNQPRITSAAIVVGNALDPSPYRSWSECVGEIRESRRRTWGFVGTAIEYITSCSSLLRLSPVGYLIDRYFDPISSENEPIIRKMFALMNGSACGGLEIITRRNACKRLGQHGALPNMSLNEIKNAADNMYRAELPGGRYLKIHFVTEGAPNGTDLRLHDRFFLTKHGAINFGQGFAIRKAKRIQMNAHVVDKSHHSILKDTYVDGVARHSEGLPRKPRIAYPLNVETIEIVR